MNDLINLLSISFFIDTLLFALTYFAIVYTFKTINRIFRSINILIRGWPPIHLDADGDFEGEL